MSVNDLVLMETSRLLESRHVDARERPLAGKGNDLVAELLHLEVAFVTLSGSRGNTNEVLEELRLGLLLKEERKLNCTVQEVSDHLDVLLAHVAGCEGGCAETDTTGYLSRCVTRNSIL